MSLFLVIPVALALAMDAFAVSIGLSALPGGLKNRQSLRLAVFFGLFQFLMPLVGWVVGQEVLHYLRDVDHWVAFGLLFIVGGKMVVESFRNQDMKKKGSGDPTMGVTLILLSVATSIDALAVGLSFAAIQQEILYPSLIIGLVAFVMTFIGTKLGPLVGTVAGKRAELLGGIVLILIGVKILVEHL
ncbi:MAG: manganese efflux pump [Candidatus Aminicenantes bacterium]|nr:MAG: manganese efflux pump [Candidatus Aminicenantes bacterium]